MPRKLTKTSLRARSNSPTARYFTQCVDRSGKVQREIAQEAGFVSDNMISMLKNGLTKLPINRIPQLAKLTDTDPVEMLDVAMTEYYPEVWAIVKQYVGTPLSEAERTIVQRIQETEARGESISDLAHLMTDAEKRILEAIRKASGMRNPLGTAEQRRAFQFYLSTLSADQAA